MRLLGRGFGVLAFLLVAWMWPASAARAASVQCSVSASAMDFGDVDPHSVTTNHDVRTSADVTYSCTNPSNVATDFSLCLGVNDGGGGYDPRRMMRTQGNGQLAFELYQPPGYPTVLGTVTGTGGTPYLVAGRVAGNGTVSGTITIGGRLVQGQTVSAGTYSRTMQGTLVVNKNPSYTQADCTAGNQTQTFQLTATANVTSACTVDAGPALDFGTPADLAQPVSGSTTITVSCSGFLGTFDIGLDQGQNAVGGVNYMRGMSSGDQIGYQLCQDAACTTPWGNTLGTDTQAGFYWFLQPTRTFTVYAKTLTTNPNPMPDTYSDTVTVFLYY